MISQLSSSPSRASTVSSKTTRDSTHSKSSSQGASRPSSDSLKPMNSAASWSSDEDRKSWWPIFHPENKYRQTWQAAMAIPLLYTGTAMPYTLCFIQFSVRDDSSPPPELGIGWDVVNYIVDIAFILDLFLQFTFSYYDPQGTLIVDPKRIAKTYLKGWLIMDFIACLPPQIFETVLGNGGNKVVRLPRLYRVARIIRLVRLVRTAKLFKAVQLIQQNPLLMAIKRWVGDNRAASVSKFTLVLFALAHLLGCLWYLIAALSEDPEGLTWLGRRELIGKDDFENWINSVHFVLTVFTTVGFGDICPVTDSEVMFGILLMMMGAILNSIIVSQVIAVLTRVDGMNVEMRLKSQAIESYVSQIDLANDPFAMKLRTFVEFTTRRKYANLEKRKNDRFDWHQVWEVICAMSPEMRESLQKQVFCGALVRNAFFQSYRSGDEALSLLTSMFLTERRMEAGAMLFNYGDQPNGMFLVSAGVAAFVAVASDSGGIPDVKIMNLGSDPGAGEHELSPYMLCCHSNYVGAWELIYPHSRFASCRVERDSIVLSLPTHAFISIVSNFPQFHENFKRVARRRETKRKQLQKDHRRVQTVESLAVLRMQSHIRGYLVRKRSKRWKAKFKGAVTCIRTLKKVDVNTPNGKPNADKDGSSQGEILAGATRESELPALASHVPGAVPPVPPESSEVENQQGVPDSEHAPNKKPIESSGVEKVRLQRPQMGDAQQLRPFEAEMQQNMKTTASRVNELQRGSEEMRSMLQQLYFLLFSRDQSTIAVDFKS